MVNYVKKSIITLIIGLVTFFIGYIMFVNKYIIRGFSVSYVICIIIILCMLLLCIKIVEKRSKISKILIILRILTLIVITAFSCSIVCEIKKELHDEEQFCNISVEGISNKYEIILYEYNSFRSNSGCLCVKINNTIYKRIPGTNYSIESGGSLTTSNNLIVNYDPKSKILIMKYRWKENIDYSEKIINWSM